MSRRTVMLVVAAIVLLAVGALGATRAQQALSEGQAHSSFLAAQTAARSQLQHAGRIGLLPAEIAQYRHQAAMLDALRAPASSLLWDGESASFYDRQVTAYRELAGQIRAAERRVTISTRRVAATRLAALQAKIGAASPLGIATAPYAVVLTAARRDLARDGTPAQFRSISSHVSASTAALVAAIGARRQFVNSLLHSAGGTLAGVVSRSDAAVGSVASQLSLLALFTQRAGSERATLDRLNAVVHQQKSPFAAAVAESAVEIQARAIGSDFSRTVPAKVILVSTEQQSVVLYQNGNQVFSAPVTTGGPELPTDHGVFHIYLKQTPFVFHSPWPPSSPYYYLPSPVTYWMPFDGGEGLHDAPWRSNFGPGSNFAPTDLGTGYSILGTHGCVNLPFDAAQFIWDWAPVGTTVVVV